MKTVLLAAFGMLALFTSADQPQPAAATYKSQAELAAALKAGQATPDMLTSPVSLDDRHRINLIKRTKPAGAVAHEGFAELHHIVDGSGTFVTGGTIVRPTGGRAPSRAAATSCWCRRACRTGTRSSTDRSPISRCGGPRSKASF